MKKRSDKIKRIAEAAAPFAQKVEGNICGALPERHFFFFCVRVHSSLEKAAKMFTYSYNGAE